MAAGVAAPSHPVGSSRPMPPIPTVRSRSSWPIRRAARPIWSAAWSARRLQQSTGKTFIIENRGGAGGNIGMGYAAHADADGYTFLLITNAFSVNVGLYKKPALRSAQGLRAGQRTGLDAEHLCRALRIAGQDAEGIHRTRARQSRQVQCVDAADRHHVANAGASCSRSAPSCRSWKAWCSRAAAMRCRRCSSKTVQLSSGSLPPAAPHIKAGTLRCLAISADQRWPDLPGRADHGRARLQGLRAGGRHGAAGAGQDAARDGQVAGDGDRQGHCRRRR